MVIGDSGCELERAEMVGAATSNTLSANSASLLKSMVALVEGSTLAGVSGRTTHEGRNCCLLHRQLTKEGIAVCCTEFVTEKLLHMS